MVRATHVEAPAPRGLEWSREGLEEAGEVDVPEFAPGEAATVDERGASDEPAADDDFAAVEPPHGVVPSRSARARCRR